MWQHQQKQCSSSAWIRVNMLCPRQVVIGSFHWKWGREEWMERCKCSGRHNALVCFQRPSSSHQSSLHCNTISGKYSCCMLQIRNIVSLSGRTNRAIVALPADTFTRWQAMRGVWVETITFNSENVGEDILFDFPILMLKYLLSIKGLI